MQAANDLQNWIARLDRRAYAILVGLSLGVISGLIGLLIAVADPIIAFGVVLGLLAGLYVLSNVTAALYGVIAVTALLPFGTFPVKIGITPTLLDLALGAFLVVYLLQWMTGRRQRIQLTPVHVLVGLYAMWLLLSFALGLRYAMPTSATLRQFAETLLSISLTFVLVDLLRDPAALRRLVLVVMVAVGIQALVAIGLYLLPDAAAERTLIRLARIGYPNGGVIRYVEDNPDLAERAIGTWVDPNALGGILTVSAAMIAPQVFASRPVLRWRWLALGVLGLVLAALILTFSRASMLAFAVGALFIAFIRYRRFIPVIAVGALLLLLLPQTQSYIVRFGEAFAGADLATQMRLGEYSDSLRLIQRYPVFGVGFTGTPEIDIYTDVANMYLIMANQIGLAGVAIYLTMIAGVFAYGLHAWRYAKRNPLLDSIHLGYHAALLTGLTNAVADLYFFRLDFQASITLFWLLMALALSSSRLALAQGENQPLIKQPE
ncbi:MAG: O-antigen ligase family protein [Anaerolineaceae bacterium]|nr:O-antigen ligase family protein [Anaerolineaceae bacterium]